MAVLANKPATRIFVGVTGASGSCYAERLINVLLGRVERVYLTATETGASVSQHELSGNPWQAEIPLPSLLGSKPPPEHPSLRVFKADNLYAPTASGSSAPTAMVVLPCSMGSLARIAQGLSTNLLERTADVMLKQKRPLILVPRESPLSPIHLRNMTALAELGVRLVMPSPGFYHRPKTAEELIDFVVGKVMEELGLEHSLTRAWNERLI